MSLINDVKKALRETAVEMDADDIVRHLALQLRYRGRIRREQVSSSLAALCASDLEVTRTRLGLYRLVEQAVILPAAPTSATINSKAVVTSDVMSPKPTQLWPGGAPVYLVVDQSYLYDSHPESDPLAGRYFVERARQHLAQPAEIVWCSTPTATVAELTRLQCRGHDVVVVSDHSVVDEALVTARSLERPIRIWRLEPGPTTPLATTSPWIAEIRDLRPEDFAPETVVPDRSALDCLRFLDESLYRKRIDRVTGRGNSHALRKQALVVGETYVARWRRVVNGESQELLISAYVNGSDIPDRLYADLLTFAACHGLQIDSARELTEHLRRGFWRAVAGPAATLRTTAA